MSRLMESPRRRTRGKQRGDATRRVRPDVLFLAPGDVGKGRVEPISWMQSCRAYAERGLDVTLVTLKVRRPDAVPTSEVWKHYGLERSFRILALPTPLRHDAPTWWFQICAGSAALVLAVLKLFACAVRPKPMVVHARSPVLLLPFAALRRALPPRRRPILVMEIHSLTSPRTGLVLRAADLVLVTSQKLARDAEHVFRLQHKRVIFSPLGPYNRVRQHPIDEARRELDLPESAAIAGYVGKLSEEICGFLLQTAAELASRANGFRLLVVGGNPGILDWAGRRVDELGLRDTVIFAGFVDPARVELYQAAANVLVCHVPETFKTFEYCTPSKCYEYQAAGRPIVATDLPLFEELFGEDGERAIRVHERTPQALARGIVQALALEDGGRAMTERAAAFVSERTWERRADVVLDAIDLLR